MHNSFRSIFQVCLWISKCLQRYWQCFKYLYQHGYVLCGYMGYVDYSNIDFARIQRGIAKEHGVKEG